MTTDRPTISLRALAKRLGCGHSTLSYAIRDRRLTAGVLLVAGRIVVTDPDAAAQQWEAIHTPRIEELIRQEEGRRKRKSGAAQNEVGIRDPLTGFAVTPAELFRNRDAYVLAMTALVSEVSGRSRAAFRARAFAAMRTLVADELLGAGTIEDIEGAELAIDMALELVEEHEKARR